MTLPLVIILFFVMIAFEGFFSGAEIALVSCDKTRLRHQAALGSRRALLAQKLISHPEFFFSTTILGTNLFVVANTVILTLFVHKQWGPEYSFCTLFLSPLILIFGELVPKSLFQKYADSLALRVSPPLFFFSRLFYPFVAFFSKLTRLLLGKVQSEGNAISLSREEIKELLNMEAKMLTWERRLLYHLFDFTETQAWEIMTPISKAYVLEKKTVLADVMETLIEKEFSRIPVYDKKAYNVVGILEIYDLLFNNDPTTTVQQLIKPPLYVPETISAGRLLKLFQQEQKNTAIVVDEHEATIGLVTLEDVTEEIVGEIEDEFDTEAPLIEKIGPKQYKLSGQIRLKVLEEVAKIHFPEENYETLNGFILSHFQRIPKTGEILRYGDLTFMIKRATAKAVQELILELPDE
ncbi:MAG: hemolysin family protein [bacterium]|nr:hemolysin family protein [bacterium]